MVMGNGLASLVSGTLHERLDRATGPSRAEAANWRRRRPNLSQLRGIAMGLHQLSFMYTVQWVCMEMYYYVVLVGIVTCMYG